MGTIGVLTFHNNENRGAILQAYSLCEALSEIFANDIELVEYRTKSKERGRRNKLFVPPHPSKFRQRLRDRKIVERWLETHITTSPDSLVTDDHHRAVEWLEKQNYDLLVTGSDEIWKVNDREDSGFFSKSSSTRPFPNLYFLDPSLSATKVAYAASGNKTDLERLSDAQIDIFKRHLAAYDVVSVRDRHTERLLEKLGIGNVYRVPDPTLLVELPSDDVESILQQNGIDLRNPILGFHGSDHPIFGDICEHYSERGYQIVTTKSSRYADVELEGVVDPFEYYNVYEHFDMVVTDSLHSTIFCLKHGTPFATIDLSSRYSDLESKTRCLLHDFSMLDRHIDAVNGDISEFFENRTDLERDFDMIPVNNRISELRQRGFEFLQLVEEKYETEN